MGSELGKGLGQEPGHGEGGESCAQALGLAGRSGHQASLCPCCPRPEEEDGSKLGLGTLWAGSPTAMPGTELLKELLPGTGAALRRWLLIKATHERSKQVTA